MGKGWWKSLLEGGKPHNKQGRLNFPNWHSKGRIKRCCLTVSPVPRPSSVTFSVPRALPTLLEVDAVCLQCESHPDRSATHHCHPSRMGCNPGASSWEHFWPMRYSWGLLTDDCETRFCLVSGTLQYTADCWRAISSQRETRKHY